MKQAVLQLPPFAVVSMRLAIAIPLLAMFAFLTGRSLWIGRRELLLVSLNSVLVCAQLALFTLGTERTTASRSIIIINSFPFFTAIFCHLLLADSRLKSRQLLGIGFAFVGIVVVFFKPSASVDHSILGDLFVLAAAVTMGAKIAYVRWVLHSTGPVQLVFWASVIGAPICAAISWAIEKDPLQLTTSSMLAVIYQGVFVSFVAVLLWTHLLAHHNPNDLTVFRLLSPPLGVAAGWLVMSDALPGNLLIGCGLICLGMLCIKSSKTTENATDAVPADEGRPASLRNQDGTHIPDVVDRNQHE